MAIPLDSRICVVGAGPGGLSTAYYLRQAGYRHVTVLEKLGRIGGLCSTITYQGRSFDLGANYLTSSYRETLKLARSVGATTYVEPSGEDYDYARQQYVSIAQDSRGDQSWTDFFGDILKYLAHRVEIEERLPRVGFAGVSQDPDLARSFAAWLAARDLTGLSRLFEIPITHMGYGSLEEIAAPYALRYMTVGTVWDLAIFASPLPHRWPKRFVDGFQRMWEQLSWQLDVETGVHVESIVRDDDGVHVAMRPTEQDDNGLEHPLEYRDFDQLVLCCPLSLDVLDRFLDLDAQERGLFSKVGYNPYCLTTMVVPDLTLPARIVNTTPLPPMRLPYVVSQQFSDNPLLSFYSRSTDGPDGPDRAQIIAGCKEMIQTMGGTPPDAEHSYDRWAYFPHFSIEDVQAGSFDQLEAMQGRRATFYSGGLCAFELIEPIVQYSQNLVATRFVG